MKFLTYFERFFFRGFNFWDRATRAEYWCVMPVIWGLIILAFVWDVQEVWDFLLRREVPPLNPLYYESFMLFTLTIFPRAALTVRRLHDSGRSGRWAGLPMVALMSGLTLTLGIGSAILSSGIAGGGDTAATAVGMGVILAALFVGSMDSFWQGMFAIAATVNAIGFDVIMATLSDLMSRVQAPDTEQFVTGFQQGMRRDPLEGVQLLAIMGGMIITPFAAAFFHLLFMLLPSQRDHNAYGESSQPPVTGGPKPKTSGNVMSGYALLYERTAAEEAALKLAQKDQLKSLYRSRVLGEPERPSETPAQ